MTNYCLALPYLEGGIELAKKFAVDHCGHDNEHDEFYKIAGISRENVWIQRSPAGSGSPDLEIISLETNDIDAMLKEFATSTHPWAVRFREYAMKAYGLDFSGPLPPLNEHIINWEEE
ncbi:MAG TPA: hypothetical protein VD710_10290 [Nitrososphaeraceae archaeon]|nr:hypothetical protein [Nitrososphaeraceae archaeon]